MEIEFSSGIINADAKTRMVNLKDIERLGMIMEGRTEVRGWGKRLEQWIKLDDTKEFILELEKKVQDTDFSSEEIYNQTGRGRHSKAWGHLYLALKYAMYVNKQLELEVLETFIEKKILDLRVLGIEAFKELNNKIDTLPDVKQIDKQYRWQIYSAIATSVNIRCNGSFIPDWDYKNAGADIQKLRKDILDASITLIDNNFIDNYKDLQRFIDNYSSRIS